MSDRAQTIFFLCLVALVLVGGATCYATSKKDCDKKDGVLVRDAAWGYNCVAKP